MLSGLVTTCVPLDLSTASRSRVDPKSAFEGPPKMKRSVFLLLDCHESPTRSIASVMAHVELADALGFHTFWVAEHHFRQFGVANPSVLLAAIAARTKRIRIGPAVAVLPYRDPLQIAEDYALVDQLSGGRLDMGVGSGSEAEEFEALGVDFDSRREKFCASLQTLRRYWKGAEEGRGVVTVQRPHPPLFIATGDERRGFEAGRAGDSILVLLAPGAAEVTLAASVVRSHREGLQAGGFGPQDAVAVVALLAHVAPTADEARRHAIPALSRLLWALSGGKADTARVYDTMQANATAVFGASRDADGAIKRLEDNGIAHVALITQFGGMLQAVAARSLQLLAPNQGEDVEPVPVEDVGYARRAVGETALG